MSAKRIVEPVVNVGKHERTIAIDRLTEGQKQVIWLGIKTTDPALATLLQNDPNIAALKKQLNATVQMTVADCNRYFEAGLKVIEEKKS